MRRCPYCGHRCRRETCQYCADLPEIERRLRDERALVDINLRHVIDVLAVLPHAGDPRSVVREIEGYPTSATLATRLTGVRVA